MTAGPIQVVPVSGGAELERFIRVPMRLNASDPAWIAPLMFERREALSPKHNPFFQHAEVQFWLAVRDGRDVGRISAQIDQLTRQDDPARPIGFFGMIAAEDDPAVFAALFEVAEAWLKARGCGRVRGPFNLSINEESGLLVKGFDTPPMMMMGHDPAYAGGRVEALGYAKAQDLFAYITPLPISFPPSVQRGLERPMGERVRMRPVDMKRFDEEIALLVDIYNDAWADNWGSIPMTEAEGKYLAESMKLILDPRLLRFMEIDGESAAFGVLLPDLNHAARDLGGRLAPFGWAKLLWRLKVQGVPRARLPLLGLRRKFARTPRGGLALLQMIVAAAVDAGSFGYKEVEMSWILEENRPIRHIIESLSAHNYKTYRVYEKALD